jgi:hypothetical protein
MVDRRNAVPVEDNTRNPGEDPVEWALSDWRGRKGEGKWKAGM